MKDIMTQVIWEATLDDIYKCEVTRTDEYKGLLKVTNTQNLFVLLEQQVGLNYGAKFGPDVDDVAEWQELSCQAVDNQ